MLVIGLVIGLLVGFLGAAVIISWLDTGKSVISDAEAKAIDYPRVCRERDAALRKLEEIKRRNAGWIRFVEDLGRTSQELDKEQVSMWPDNRMVS